MSGLWHYEVSLVVVENINEDAVVRLVVWEGLKGIMWKPHIRFGELGELKKIKMKTWIEIGSKEK